MDWVGNGNTISKQKSIAKKEDPGQALLVKRVMLQLEFFSGGINGEQNVLDACGEFGVFASGSNLVSFNNKVFFWSQSLHYLTNFLRVAAKPPH